jgi:biotin carboxylase
MTFKMFVNKKILFLNIGWEQEPLLFKLKEYGMLIYGVHYNESYNKELPIEEVFIADLRDIENILKFAKKIGPDYVISDECDYSHFTQALIAETFGISGPTIMAAQISANKYLQRSKAKQEGILTPEFALIRFKEDIYKFIESVGYPIILKPIDNRGSFGVVKVNNEHEIDKAYLDAIVNSYSRLLIAEQFINGTEITVDGYCFKDGPKSLSLAKKDKSGLSVQVSMDIKYPGELDDVLYEKAMLNNEFVNKRLGYLFGMTHSEYMIDANGDIYLIESANRGGGVFTSLIIVPNVSGIDLINIYINDVCGGGGIVAPKTIEKNNVILKFFSFPEGQVKEIEGIDLLRSKKDLLNFRLAIKPGDVIKPIETDANRHGFLIVKSDVDVRKVADNLFKSISIKYY